MEWPFVPHQLYNRRRDIHGPYAGQQQGGIATPANTAAIFLFTGHGARKVGYGDEWLPDGSIRYTGEGQTGDMVMVRGNAAIRDHVVNGKDLLLFEKTKSGGPVRYVGQFVCSGWENELQLDTHGAKRLAIVFHLTPIEQLTDEKAASYSTVSGSLEELRAKAYAASSPAPKVGSTRATIFERSRAVRSYVFARANGTCEACARPSPFQTPGAQPYLEAHHIKRLSDGGPDAPDLVAAICPNCHREAHFGANKTALNARLIQAVAILEAEAEKRAPAK